MSGGALLQLCAVGKADEAHLKDPEITFFKTRHRTHSNFSLEAVRQKFLGKPGFGRTVSCTLAHHGDLLRHVDLEITLPTLSGIQQFYYAVQSDDDLTDWPAGDVPSGTWTRTFKPTPTNDIRKANFNTTLTYVPGFARHLVQQADLEIGGALVDRQFGRWLHIWNELAGSESHRQGDDRATGNSAEFLEPCFVADHDPATEQHYLLRRRLESRKVTVPLNFWFCKRPALALPLLALRHQEVRIVITFSELKPLLRQFCTTVGSSVSAVGAVQPVADNPPNGTPDDAVIVSPMFSSGAHSYSTQSWRYDLDYEPPLGDDDHGLTYPSVVNHGEFDVVVWAEYVYLDREERTRFATRPHTYLIEQLQHETHPVQGEFNRLDLTLSHPVKELVWCVNSKLNPAGVYAYPSQSAIESIQGYVAENQLSRRVDYQGSSPVENAQLVLNGRDRFEARTGSYFDSDQPRLHHSRTPQHHGIHVYAFGIAPEEFNPNGSLNFSVLDSATLKMRLLDYTAHSGPGNYYHGATIDVWALNHNSLVIQSGIGSVVHHA
jgi:hypothetical protein